MNVKRTVVLLAALTIVSVTSGRAADLAWPDATHTTKPWTRWWWLGSIVEDRDLTTVMEQYSAAGLGGLELTPIYGVRGDEGRFIQFLSPAFVDRLEHTLREGRRLGLGVDMTTGTGWPFGGPFVDPDHGSRYLALKAWTVPAGGRLDEAVANVQKPILRFAGPRRVPITELRQPVTANPNLQDLAIDQVRFELPLPLLALMAYSKAGDAVDLTTRVGSDGRLDWTAPEGLGEWRLVGAFAGWHGKMVERAAPGGEGPAIDHLSHEALGAYLAHFDEAFAGRDLKGLRAFFNDSYEVDDSTGEANWTPRLLDEFQRRRGYDLKGHLPALLATEPSDEASRVTSDYRETVSDLMLDEFTKPWRSWAAGRGSIIRNQAHGSPANILDLYAASDIPEQEGSDVVSIKLASSATHLTGRRLTSSESATWLDEHFIATLGAIRDAVDRLFLGGVNHVFYHGTAYSPPSEPWPGFQFYAAVELNPANPIWADFPALNRYVTRTQSFLQAGEPDEDVLVYYDIHDRWAVRGNGAMPHFHGRENEGVHAYAAARSLRGAGYGFDFVSDRLLEGVDVREGQLTSGSATYRALVLPETNVMPIATLRRIGDLLRKGATVVVQGHLPEDASGFGAPRDEFHRVRADLEGLLTQGGSTREGPVGRGRLYVGDDLAGLLTRAGLTGEPLVAKGLEYVRRRTTDGGHHYFIVNRGAESYEGWLPLAAEGSGAAIFDPATGDAGVARCRREKGPAGTSHSLVYLQLGPGESRVLQLSKTAFKGQAARYWHAAGTGVPIGGPWSVSFATGGPQTPQKAEVPAPASWTEFGGEAALSFGGTGSYATTVQRPSGSARAWRLALGRVAESARVRLYGREIAALIHAPFAVVILAADLADHNTLEIDVTNLGANRIADLDRHGVIWKRFYNANMPARRPENRGPDGLFTAAGWAP